jgi:hypothetical protein
MSIFIDRNRENIDIYSIYVKEIQNFLIYLLVEQPMHIISNADLHQL